MIVRFYKPYGVHSKFIDREGRPTLAPYLPIGTIRPVGRLDHDSEGLLLLSDDGTLIHRLTDPTFELPKTYLVQVEGTPDKTALSNLRAGVLIQGYQTRPARADVIETPLTLPPRDPPIRFRATIPTAWLRLTIHEGKNRQVRHMTAAVGHPTLRLVRVAVAGLMLDGLEPGAHQVLTALEVRAFRKALSKVIPKRL